LVDIKKNHIFANMNRDDIQFDLETLITHGQCSTFGLCITLNDEFVLMLQEQQQQQQREKKINKLLNE